jgi:hypothetical protein
MFSGVPTLLLIVSVMCGSPAASVPSPRIASSAVDAARDARLARRVRLRAEAIPLGKVLRALADETGVRMNVAGTAGDERLVAFVPGTSLAEVMLAIADLYRLSWIRSGSAERPSYQLLKLPALAREEQALRERSVRQLLARLGEKLRSPERPAGERPDPWAPVFPLVMPLLMARSDDLQRDGHVYLSVAALPAEQRGPLVRVLQPVMDARHAELREFARASRERRQAEGKSDLVSSAEISPAPTAESSTITMELAVGGELMASVGLKTGVGIGYGWLSVAGEGLQAAGMDLYQDRRPTLPAETDEQLAGAESPGTDPLARRVEVVAEKSPRQGDWIGALGRLSDASGVALYADCYPNFLEGIDGHPRSDFSVSGEISVARALNRFCFPLANRGAKKLAVSSFWWRRGDAALIRSRRWLWESAAVLPTDLLDRMIASLRAARHAPTAWVPDPNDLPAIASLTGLQVQSVGFLDGGWDVWHRAVQVPARLSMESRKLLLTGGLTWEKMPPADRSLMERSIPRPPGGSLSRYSARLKTSVHSNPSQGGTVASMEIEAMGETQMEAVFLHLPLPGVGAAPGLPPQGLEVVMLRGDGPQAVPAPH